MVHGNATAARTSTALAPGRTSPDLSVFRFTRLYRLFPFPHKPCHSFTARNPRRELLHLAGNIYCCAQLQNIPPPDVDCACNSSMADQKFRKPFPCLVVSLSHLNTYSIDPRLQKATVARHSLPKLLRRSERSPWSFTFDPVNSGCDNAIYYSSSRRLPIIKTPNLSSSSLAITFLAAPISKCQKPTIYGRLWFCRK